MKRLLACFLLLFSVAAHAETRWTLVHSYPHDPRAFTEGLFYHDGSLYESTGLNGTSQIRKVRLSDGKTMQKVDIPSRHFGEGIVNWGDEIISLTWQDGIGFRWKQDTFERTGSFRYNGEGWGLTQDGRRLIMSDGTDKLRFLDPVSLTQIGSVPVTYQGKPVHYLNELEYVKGEVLANVWMTDLIARIDPETGHVTDFIDLAPLSRTLRLSDPDSVLNGIAYDATADRLFVTGKNWPKLYEIRITR